MTTGRINQITTSFFRFRFLSAPSRTHTFSTGQKKNPKIVILYCCSFVFSFFCTKIKKCLKLCQFRFCYSDRNTKSKYSIWKVAQLFFLFLYILKKKNRFLSLFHSAFLSFCHHRLSLHFSPSLSIICRMRRIRDKKEQPQLHSANRSSFPRPTTFRCCPFFFLRHFFPETREQIAFCHREQPPANPRNRPQTALCLIVGAHT